MKITLLIIDKVKEFSLMSNKRLYICPITSNILKKWLRSMHSIRRSWIFTFFKNVPMSSLMETTSLLRIQNWSFQKHTLTGSTLVNFLIIFESYPSMVTCLPYEAHIAEVYTQYVFYEVQLKTVQSQKSCFQTSVNSKSVDTFLILEKHKPINTVQQVNLDEGNNVEEYHYDMILNDSKCTYVGILCRHIFCVFQFFSYNKIPDIYVWKNWCRDVIHAKLLRGV
uniref:SWIM-type domain-containing protein n=1 Tax=Lactuca sativa TaxID=4236 RepID=A0A9R1VQU7_LACSA|nr:hypothetical protein LSAT_V11C400190320 [Lactuca sativa]